MTFAVVFALVAACCVSRLTALEKAATKANTTARVTPRPHFRSGRCASSGHCVSGVSLWPSAAPPVITRGWVNRRAHAGASIA